MKRWLVAFIVLNVADAGLTWIAIEESGGYEVLGFLFAWLPTTASQMYYKLAISVAVGLAAYYVKAQWILKLGIYLVAICCTWNGIQIISAFS